MHDPGSEDGNQSDDIQAAYPEEFMNLDDNLFVMDSGGRDLVFGMS